MAGGTEVGDKLRSLRCQRRAVRRRLREMHQQGEEVILLNQQGGIGHFAAGGDFGASHWTDFFSNYQSAVDEMARLNALMQFWRSE